MPPRPVSIVAVQYDAPGDDRENLAEEYVVIAAGERTDLSGWTLADTSGTVYTFPSRVLGPGERLVLHTGQGIDRQNDLYWNQTFPVLGNTADAVTLRDPTGRVVSTYRWGGG
ncbi:MAG: lamin tail domain-containing protein [Methanolinea sp.]|nr:lamin tail domain-containing protein [Methanolinea sp.]